LNNGRKQTLGGCRKSANEICIFSSSQDPLGRVLLVYDNQASLAIKALEDSAREGAPVKIMSFGLAKKIDSLSFN
jgi:hypothetical protein